MDLNKVDFDKINSLTADEIIIANILDKAAREANEAVELIYNTYSFKMGEEKIEVWHNGAGNFEYLTYEGEWEGSYIKNGTYRIKCGKKNSEIYAYFYAQALLKEGFVTPETEFSKGTTYEEMNLIAIYFRDFIRRTRAKAEKMEKAEKSKTRKNQSQKNSITNESKELTVNRKEEEIENEEIVKEQKSN